jgi:hypothetical protein
VAGGDRAAAAAAAEAREVAERVECAEAVLKEVCRVLAVHDGDGGAG